MAFIALAAMAQSTMTDQQVLDYVKQGMAAGKSQKVMMQELVSRGVDRAQAQRVRRLYEQQMGGGANTEKVEAAAAATREHTPNGETAEEVDQLNNVEILERTATDEVATPDASNAIYGHGILSSSNLTFAPSANMPTPKNYTLGAGDEVIVDIFGVNESTIRSVINPEGYIKVDILGPVYLTGKTIAEANTYLKKRLATIYEGLNNGEEDVTDIQLSLGQIRSIQITIMGEVPAPGTFMVSSLSTAFHAMHRAGGVTNDGSVRAIKVIRNNRTISTIDIYDFLMTGSRKNDIRLEEGDIIMVEPYQQIVKLNGYVKRPMNFELKKGETVKDLLKYAGGFSRAAYTGSITVVRQNEREYEVRTVESKDYGTFVLVDGDEIEVTKMEARFENRIAIKGAVMMPGLYELGEIKTVKQLLEKAGGLQPDAFTERVMLHRENDDRSLETMGIDLDGIMKGTKADVVLRKNDELYIPSVFDLKDQGTLTIRGEVASPGTFPYAANTTIQDLILQAGGMLRSASVARIDVDRMIEDSESLMATSEIAQHFTFNMKDGYSLDGAASFVLEPYDVVTVRRSPSYVPGKTVTIAGEANFPGVYHLNKRQERVSDLVARSGDLTDFAYVKGAHITRLLTDDERDLAMTAIRAMVNNGDSLVPVLRDEYTVSLDLEMALKHPGSEYDLVLREGDVLEVPVFNNTVSIRGAVQLQTTVTYEKGLTKKKLVDMAGGYLKRAYKSKAFIVYMNGSVARLKWNTPIEPGCQVFIPIKAKKNNTTNIAQGVSIATAAASLGMMGVSIANLLK